MWLFDAEKDSLEDSPTDERDSPRHSSTSESQRFGRYRAFGRFYERYWSRLFGVTQADMARIAEQNRVLSQAPTLTSLAQDVIRTRLREGPQLQSGPAPATGTHAPPLAAGATPPRVARWDPTAVWSVGDYVILAMPAQARGRTYAPRLGEVTAADDDRVVMHVDGVSAPQVLPLGRPAVTERDAAAASEMRSLAEDADEAAQIDYILWTYGSHVVGRLLQALVADERFVAMEGRWLLRDLASKPRDADLSRLATAMFEEERGSVTMSEALSFAAGTDSGDYPERVGLALALNERSDLFRNVGTRTYPRWELAGPPATSFTANHPVYDPESYAILCMPGDTLSRATAQRLWNLGLLRAAIAPVTDTPAALAGRPPESHPALQSEADMVSDARPSNGRTWPKWLRFSRQ